METFIKTKRVKYKIREFMKSSDLIILKLLKRLNWNNISVNF